MNTKHYYSDEPCSRGHYGPRLKSTRSCIECVRGRQKIWRADPENRRRELAQSRLNKATKGYYYHEQAKVRMRDYYRRKKGIPSASRPTPEHCECCGKTLLGGKYTHLDHCHKTGKFRGWLCNRCNRGLGYFDDCVEGLERAISYLKRSDSSLLS